MANYAQLIDLEKKKKGQTPVSTFHPASQPKKQPPKQSNIQPTNLSISQSADQPANQPTSISHNQIVERPKSFYITKRLDQRLDDAVRYIQEKHSIRKADRSLLVNAIMDNDANWSKEALTLLVDKIISQLTSRLTSR